MKNDPYLLYAEDDDDDVMFLRDVLTHYDIHKKLVTVSNGYDVMKHLQEVREGKAYPCLIILDLNMPKLNGLQVLELLKTDDLYRLIPVLVLTLNASEKDIDYCKLMGTEIIHKPVYYNGWEAVMVKLCSYFDD